MSAGKGSAKAAGRVSNRAALSDLWGGFGAGERGVASASGAAASPLTGGAGSRPLAIALLSLGLLGVCGSFALVALRRRAEAEAPAAARRTGEL